MPRRSCTETNKFGTGAVLTNGQSTIIVLKVYKMGGRYIYRVINKDTGVRVNYFATSTDNMFKQIDLLNMGTLDILYGSRD